MKKIYKTFGLTNWALSNHNTVKLLILIITLGGLIAYIGLPRESFPTVSAPEVFVSTPYPGNAPQDIESLITRPLKLEIKKIKGVDEITSVSSSGFSSIDIKFKFDVDPDKALADVKDKIDEVTSGKDWPSDVPTDPKAVKLDFSEMMPIMNINISGNYPSDELKKMAEALQDEIEQLPQISAADIRGVQDKEVEVAVDLNEMIARNITFNNITQAIKNENLNVSAGEIKEGTVKRNVRVTGEIKNPKELENIIIRKQNDKAVYLKDVARIKFKQKEAESYAREFGKPVVMLDVKKQSGANQIEAAEAINRIIKKFQKEILPEDVNVNITNDLSDRTKTQVSDLENSIILGTLLVVFILMLFLGTRSALFVGIAIPLSMLMSFLILSFMGVTLNTMVLFALVLALGMLVDNGIVIVENIYRYRQEGYKALEAAKYAVGEVAWPIIASTATTVAAFIPLAMWPGIIGEFMKYLPLTLMIVLSSSLFVALIINPVLTKLYMKTGESVPDDTETVWRRALFFLALSIILFIVEWLLKNEIGSIRFILNSFGVLFLVVFLWILLNHYVLRQTMHWFQYNFLPKLEMLYENTIRWTLSGKKSYLVFFSTVFLLIFSIMLLKIFPLKTSFFPNTEPNQLYIYIKFPIATDIEVVNKFTKEQTKKIQSFFKENNLEYMVRSIVEQVGEGTDDPRRERGNKKTPNKAKIIIDFVKFDERKGVSTSFVMDELRKILKGYAGIQVSVDKDQHKPPMGPPVDIKLMGDDYDILFQTALDVKKYIDKQGIQGIEDLQPDIDKNNPELNVVIDREKAGQLGIKTGQIGMALRTAIYGSEADLFKQADDDYPINVRLAKQYRYDRDKILDLNIIYRNPQNGRLVVVPVSSVASLESKSTFSKIKRKDLKRVISLQSNVLEGYNANEIVNKIDKLLKKYPFPEGVKYTIEGEQKEMKKNFKFLSKALLIAVALIFLILVMQFNSMKVPFLIMITVVLSTIGVLLGLIVTRAEFIVVMTMIGIISLAGIVVNNAIVLIDYINLTIKRKRLENHIPEEEPTPMEIVRESIVHAGKTRLRPVLLTAITTILGLIPLAIGMNFDFFGLFTKFDPNFYTGGENVAFWGPLAKAVIYGLTFATFLTLVVVPAMYYITLRWSKER